MTLSPGCTKGWPWVLKSSPDPVSDPLQAYNDNILALKGSMRTAVPADYGFSPPRSRDRTSHEGSL